MLLIAWSLCARAYVINVDKLSLITVKTFPRHEAQERVMQIFWNKSLQQSLNRQWRAARTLFDMSIARVGRENTNLSTTVRYLQRKKSSMQWTSRRLQHSFLASCMVTRSNQWICLAMRMHEISTSQHTGSSTGRTSGDQMASFDYQSPFTYGRGPENPRKTTISKVRYSRNKEISS